MDNLLIIEIEPSKSFMAPHFSPNARETVRKYLLSHSMDAIQGFTFGADSLKSLVLMSAIVNKRLTVEDAVNLGRLETQFQVSTFKSHKSKNSIFINKYYNYLMILTQSIVIY